MEIIRKIIPKNPVNSETSKKITERVKHVLEVFGKYYANSTKTELVKNKIEEAQEKEERKAFVKKDLEKKTKYYKEKYGQDEEIPQIPEPPEKDASLDTKRDYCIKVYELGFKPLRPRGKIEPLKPPELRIKVLRYEIRDSSYDPYAVYIIRASKGKFSGQRERRFKEFKKLHKKIKKLIPKDKEKEIIIPEKSSKIGIRNLTPKFLEERVEILGKYLKNISEIPEIQENEDFLSFIGLLPPKDPLDDQIFSAAFEKTRWHFWYIPSFDFDRPEDALTRLITLEVWRSVKSDIENALPTAETPRKTSLKLAFKLIAGIIEPLVPPTWTTAYKASGPVRDKVKEVLGQVIEIIISKKNEINDQLKENMLEFFKPIQEAFSKLLTMAAPKVLPPIIKPFIGIFKTYSDKSEPLFLEAFNNCDKNKMKEGIDILNKIHEDLVAKLNEEVNKELKNICEELKGAVTLRLLQDCFNPMNAIGPIISDFVGIINPKHWGKVAECLLEYKQKLKTNEENIDNILNDMERNAKFYIDYEAYLISLNAWRIRGHIDSLGFDLDCIGEVLFKFGEKVKKKVFKQSCKKLMFKFSDYVWGFKQKKTDDKSWSEKVDEAFIIAYNCAKKKFNKECGNMIKEGLCDILEGMILNKVIEEIKEKLKPFIEKAASLVPENIKDLVDIEDMANEDIEEVLTKTFEDAIDNQDDAFVKELNKCLGTEDL